MADHVRLTLAVSVAGCTRPPPEPRTADWLSLVACECNQTPDENTTAPPVGQPG